MLGRATAIFQLSLSMKACQERSRGICVLECTKAEESQLVSFSWPNISQIESQKFNFASGSEASIVRVWGSQLSNVRLELPCTPGVRSLNVYSFVCVYSFTFFPRHKKPHPGPTKPFATKHSIDVSELHLLAFWRPICDMFGRGYAIMYKNSFTHYRISIFSAKKPAPLWVSLTRCLDGWMSD